MNLNQWTNHIAQVIGNQLEYSEDQEEVLAYGLLMLLHTLTSIVVVGIVGFCFGVTIESLMISFAIAILRKASGGVHATSAFRCMLLGTIVSVGGAILCISNQLEQGQRIGVAIVLFIVCYYIVYKEAPKDSKTKPIKNVSKKARLRKRSISILILYSVGWMLFCVIGSILSKQRWTVYGECIVFGMLWQTFTLTKWGDKLINYIDRFFINISKRLSGGN
ncbi:MAG: accessory gene regulator ArgB-like protein [Cellulosilyticaceae bacterium]